MKRNSITLAAALVLLAGAVAALILLRQPDAAVEEETPAAGETVVLGGTPSPFVQSVEVENAADTFTIVNGFANAIQQENSADSRYSIPGLPDESLNQTMLKSVMNTAGRLVAKKVVAESGAELSAYGLDAPAAAVTVAYEDKTVRMEVGGDAPGGSGVYVTLGQEVFLVEKSAVSNLSGNRLSFVNKTVTPGNSETTQPAKITLSGANYPEPIVISKAEDTEAAQMAGFSTYAILSPIRSAADSSKGIPPLQSVYGLTADQVVAQAAFGAAAAEYGLAEPYLTAEVETLPAEGADPIAPFTLILSAPDADGFLYAQVSGAEFVYRLSASSLTFLGMTLFDFQEKMVLLPAINTVSEVEISAGDAIYLFRLTGEGDELKVTIGDTELDTKNFRQFYQTLISAHYDSEIEPDASAAAEPGEAALDTDAAGLVEEPGTAQNAEEEQLAETAEPDPAGQPELLLSITYRYRDGRAENTVRFQAGPTRKAVISLDGGHAYYTPSTYVDKVLEDLPKVVAGEAVKSYY